MPVRKLLTLCSRGRPGAMCMMGREIWGMDSYLKGLRRGQMLAFLLILSILDTFRLENI